MNPSAATAAAPPAPPADAVNAPARASTLSALAAVFVLTLRGHLRGRRLLVLALLFLLPSVLAGLVRLARFPPSPQEAEFAFVFNLIPHALATLTALLYAAGTVQDEVEDQTLTYLLVRPLPRWALYVTKMAATLLVTCLLTGVFTSLAYLVIYWGTPELWGEILPERAAKSAALLALAQAAYCPLFGALGLYTRRAVFAVFAGLAYIVAFEGILASFESVMRRLTVMFYYRVLVARWLGPPEAKSWSLDLPTAPTSSECVEILLAIGAAFLLLGAVLMTWKEFRMKTPEGT
jgi:ABC-2 type transport system permease protein